MVQFQSDGQQSYLPPCVRFLIITKRHLNCLSVTCRSSRKPKTGMLYFKDKWAKKKKKKQYQRSKLCSRTHNKPTNSAFESPKRYCRCRGFAKPSVNKHFHALHRVYNTVSGSYNECREAKKKKKTPIRQAFASPRWSGATAHTNRQSPQDSD